jgi:hypothetical protein
MDHYAADVAELVASGGERLVLRWTEAGGPSSLGRGMVSECE